MDSDVEILLVEDNPRDVELMLLAFEAAQIANRVQVARDGAEALDYIFGRGARVDHAAWTRPHLILLDLKLPLVDGIEVLRQLKADPRARSIPIVVLTSSSQEPDIATCYALGVNSYIVKPVDFEKFLEAIRLLHLYWLVVNIPPPEQTSLGGSRDGAGCGATSSALETT